jgi:hypothetical protein
MGSWRGHLHEESVREHGWIRAYQIGTTTEGRNSIIRGRVVAIDDDKLLIVTDEIQNDQSEEFALNVPARGVFLGDTVRVTYRTDNGRKIVVRIEELSSRQ